MPSMTRGVRRELRPGAEVVVTVGAAVTVQDRHLVGGRRRAGAAGSLIAVRTDPGHHAGVAVVGAVQHHDVLPPGDLPGNPPRQVVGLAAGADQEHYL